jgi:hypothetical protein
VKRLFIALVNHVTVTAPTRASSLLRVDISGAKANQSDSKLQLELTSSSLITQTFIDHAEGM